MSCTKRTGWMLPAVAPHAHAIRKVRIFWKYIFDWSFKSPLLSYWLTPLISGNPWCVHGLGQKVWEKVINADQEPNDWQIRPRKSGIYVGLRNLGKKNSNSKQKHVQLHSISHYLTLTSGATCYVNAFIQLWFHNTALRRALYSWCPQSVKRQRIDNNGYKHLF